MPTPTEINCRQNFIKDKLFEDCYMLELEGGMEIKHKKHTYEQLRVENNEIEYKFEGGISVRNKKIK